MKELIRLIRYFKKMRQQIKINQDFINLAKGKGYFKGYFEDYFKHQNKYKKNDNIYIILSKMNKAYIKTYKHSFYYVKKGSEISTIYHLLLKTSHEKEEGKENIPVNIEEQVYISRVQQIIQLEEDKDINQIFISLTDPEIDFRRKLFQNEETEEKFVKMCQEIDLDLSKLKKSDSTEFFYFNEKLSALRIEELLSEWYSFDEIDKEMELWDKCVTVIKLDNNINIEKLKDMELDEVNNLLIKLRSKNEE
jgi:hypothetical protein